MNTCEIIGMVVSILILVAIFAGCCFANSNKISNFVNEKFSNQPKELLATPSYEEYNKYLEEINKTDDVGMPPGILKISNNKNCDTKKIQMPQKHVSFNPEIVSGGCTYVDPVWE
jgi:hypothetical protein